MLRAAKGKETIPVAARRRSATVSDLRTWRQRIQVSKKVKELEAENAVLKRLAAHSAQEVTALRKLLAGSSTR